MAAMWVVAGDVDRERSLAAMWHALRASRVGCDNQVVTNSSVVRDLLNAGYYDPNRGHFLSEDRKFITASQDLKDPQRLNAYAYGRNNPITLFDISGLDSAYFAARVAFANGYHIYEAYSV